MIDVTEHFGLVSMVARKQYLRPVVQVAYGSEEDVFQEGILGLLKAATHFDASKGFVFSTYASRVIWHAIDHGVRKKLLMHGAIRGEQPRWIHDGDALEREAMQPHDDARDILARLDTLSPRQREAIVRWYGLGTPRETLTAIGASWGISKERVRQIVLEGYERLRNKAPKRRPCDRTACRQCRASTANLRRVCSECLGVKRRTGLAKAERKERLASGRLLFLAS